MDVGMGMGICDGVVSDPQCNSSIIRGWILGHRTVDVAAIVSEEDPSCGIDENPPPSIQIFIGGQHSRRRKSGAFIVIFIGDSVLGDTCIGVF